MCSTFAFHFASRRMDVALIVNQQRDTVTKVAEEERTIPKVCYDTEFLLLLLNLANVFYIKEFLFFLSRHAAQN